MNKKSAQDIINQNKKINESIEKNITKDNDVGNKLLKDNGLTLEDITELGERIAQQQGYDKNQLIVCNFTELNEQLQLHKDDDINENPIFVICLNEKDTKATFCILKISDKTICLYKNFYCEKIPNNMKQILKQHCENIKIHSEIDETKNEKNHDVLSLKTLETMMFYLKLDKKNDFIEGFADPKKSYFDWLKNKATNLKNELFSLVKDGYFKTIIRDIDHLSNDIEFKKAIKAFIKNIPLLNEVVNLKTYQKLLKEFVEIEENEIETEDVYDKIKELNEKLKEVKKIILNNTKNLNIETYHNEKGDLELEIIKNFPTQMEKFTRIFEKLTKCQVDEELNKILREISFKLDLEYDKLTSFFKIKKTQETKQEDASSIFYSNGNFINDLPKFKIKNLNTSNISKTFEQLLTEITIEQSDTFNRVSLKKNYRKIKDYHNLWNDKKAPKIHEWASLKKGKLVNSDVCEALAVMDRANELVTGHKLRDTQILSILTFLQQGAKGHISQIQTGEGKTTIVSILAAIKALQGKNVDVITSNPILASDGVKDRKYFYNLLGLMTSTNNLDENYKIGERGCYKADIVYGSIGNFQFDYLKDSFLGLKTRAGRPFGCIILDEVDSMIIDNASHIAKLSGPFPGLESLKYIYIKIWQALYKAEEEIIDEFEKKLISKIQELRKLSDSEEAESLYEKFANELQDSIIDRIKDYIKSSNPTKIDLIPSHIQEYADNSLDKWINSAIDAKFHYHEDEHYVIRKRDGEEVIQPVDYINTGITLKNTIWQYGLHQFLQLKHNLHLTSESLTNCFISNLGYINKYGCEIFGLTGTLGSKAEQDLLSSIYNVNYAKIPTYREKKFTEIRGEVVDDEIFFETIADDAVSEVNKARSCLIICETIKAAKTMQDVLKENNISVKLFFGEEHARITEKEIDHGEVIIATNIAGRGTDFKTSSILESNGGLHVCIAFLPCNKRVEDQAFGRTARQGNLGTAKLIIRKSEVDKLEIDSDNIEEVKKARDFIEIERIEHIKKIKILELKFQDKLFELFSSLYKKLKKDDHSERKYKYVLDDLKEFWAFWLEKNGFKGSELSNKNPEKEFENFISEAREIIGGKIVFNPYYSIKQAEYLILNEKLDEAEKAVKNAIKLCKNPEILHGAYLKLFEIEIEKGRVFLDKCRKAVGNVFFIPMIEPDRKYKENAKKCLEKAKNALKKELDYIANLFNDKEFINIINDSSDEFNDRPNVKDVEKINPSNTGFFDTVKEFFIFLFFLILSTFVWLITLLQDRVFDQLTNKPQEKENTLTNKPQEKENLFLRHLISKQEILNLNICHIDGLIKQIDEYKDGITIVGRIPDYFSNMKPQNDVEKKIKNTITNSELSELAIVGTNTTFALREVHDVCTEIVEYARIQIRIGIALYATGVCFPPALPVTSAFSGTMITEGICDIAIEVINQNSDGKFHKQAYIKGKVISYGMALLTMGINAALQCPKILNAAKRACRWLSATLRKCPYLKTACEFLANNVQKLGDWFEKMEVLAKFNKMSKAEKLSYLLNLENAKDVKQLRYLGDGVKQLPDLIKELSEVGHLKELTHYENCISNLQSIIINTTSSTCNRVVQNLVMNKVVTPMLSSLTSELKPMIKEHVKKCINENIDKKLLKLNSYDDLRNIMIDIKESIDYETICGIFKDAILEQTKYCSNWKFQLTALIIDQCISWEEVYNYAKKICKKINEKLKFGKYADQNIDELTNQLTEQLTEEMYAQFLSATAKTFSDIYSVGKQVYRNYKRMRMAIEKCLEINENFKEGGPTGQIQAEAFSDLEKRPIHIYGENGKILVVIGKDHPGDPIKLLYFSPDENNSTGHYVLFGQSKDSFSSKNNNCFFDAVGLLLGKDPNELRKNTLNQIESDPTHYISPDVMDIFGPDIFLEGGKRKNQPITEDYYPSYDNRIKVGFELVNDLADFRNLLNECKNDIEKFYSKNHRKQFTHIKSNKSIPQFGDVPGKEEMMIGVLYVTFTNGMRKKFVTLSGDEPFSVRQSVNDIKDLDDKTSPIPFKVKNRGYEFVDPGKPKGTIYDVYNRQATNVEYKKSCAAQKLFYHLGVYMKENRKLSIKEIKMAESWYKPGNPNIKGNQIIINKSCKYCEHVLPIATGANFS